MPTVEIAGRKIGQGHPVWIVAELSGNARTYEEAVALVKHAYSAGANAVKLQTYTADTITLNCDNEHFRINQGPWKGRTLYDLYTEAAMPWEWQPKLKVLAENMDMILFSTPFDFTAVDFLETMGVPCYKIASFEIVDLPLIRYAATKGKPLIMSTGIATATEINEATWAVEEGLRDRVYVKENRPLLPPMPMILLKCTSGYPAPVADMNLETIRHWADYRGRDAYGWDRVLIPGLSDHTLSTTIPVAAVTLGACVVEKHLCLSRAIGGPDSGFSLEPHEFAEMVKAVRDCEAALGTVSFGPTRSEEAQFPFRRSLFAVEDIKVGEPLTVRNVRSIRPAAGLAPRHYNEVLECYAIKDIARGTPLAWHLISHQ